ncbi:MAG: glycine cleavage system aminomethyltransferase GcvT [Planctomycetota bacterium]
MEMTGLPQSPLHARHEAAGGRFVAFAGWRMPLHFGSILDEHRACRSSAAWFDVSHMGRLELTGPTARRIVEALVTRRVSDMDPGRVRYALVCQDDGGVIDDVLVYRREEAWLLVVNASNRAAVVDQIGEVAQRLDLEAELADQTEATAMAAVQGPDVMGWLGRFSAEAARLKRYGFLEIELLGRSVLISRTGYTGEDGVEAIFDARAAAGLFGTFEESLAEGDQPVSLPPAGLGARDTLRIEAGLPLYGHELSQEVNPIEAGLGFAVSLDKGQEPSGPQVPRFIGQDALERVSAQGPSRRLMAVAFEGRRTPRQGAALRMGDRVVGQVTSGCLSPTLGQPIGIAWVEASSAEPGTAVQATVGSARVSGVLRALPLYRRAKKG